MRPIEKRAAGGLSTLLSIIFSIILVYLTSEYINKLYVLYGIVIDKSLGILIAFLFINIILRYIILKVVSLLGFERFVKTMILKKAELEQNIKVITDNNKRVAKKVIRSQYGIKSIHLSHKSLAFEVKLNGEINSNLPPIISVNNTIVGVEITGKSSIRCHVGSAINAEIEVLKFSTKEKTTSIKNPYFMNPGKVESPIIWQNEGHEGERVILIPREFFPFSLQGVVYLFTLFINDFSTETLIGKCEKSYIVVNLHKYIGKKDVFGKKTYLRLGYGRKNKIILPEPVLLSKNYQPLIL